MVLCDTLTTRMLIRRSPLLSHQLVRHRRPRDSVLGLALLVVGQDLQLLAEIDLADVDSFRHREHGRREVEDAGDAADPPAGRRRACAASAGVAITAIAAPVSATTLLEVGRGRRSPGRGSACRPAPATESTRADDPEPAGGEAGVVGQRGAQVAEPDDDHRPVVGRADLTADLEAQVLHVVADAAGAVRAEVGQVLAQLGRTHPGRLGERAAADGVDCPGRRDWPARADRPAAGPRSPRDALGDRAQRGRRQETGRSDGRAQQRAGRALVGHIAPVFSVSRRLGRSESARASSL